MYLCEKCARENGTLSTGAPLNIGDFFSGLLGLAGKQAFISNDQALGKKVCDKCGMSFADFQASGKIGCGNCYSVFSDSMEGLLKRLHGSVQHTGKVPDSLSEKLKVTREVENLKTLLNKAIQSEEYEKAAELRDMIRELEV